MVNLPVVTRVSTSSSGPAVLQDSSRVHCLPGSRTGCSQRSVGRRDGVFTLELEKSLVISHDALAITPPLAPEVRRGAERIIRELIRPLAAAVTSHGFTAGSPRSRPADAFARCASAATSPTTSATSGSRVRSRHGCSEVDAVPPSCHVTSSPINTQLRSHRPVYTQLGVPLRSWCDTRRRRRAPIGRSGGRRYGCMCITRSAPLIPNTAGPRRWHPVCRPGVSTRFRLE